MDRIVCVRCGKPYDGRTVFIGSLCIDCFLEVNKLLCVPQRIDLPYCKFCGSVRIGFKWMPGGELAEVIPVYTKTVLSKVKPCMDIVGSYSLSELTPLTEVSWRTLFLATYEITLRNPEINVKQSYRVEVRAIPTICPSCHMARGGDYNVLMQIRGRMEPELVRALAVKLDELGGKVIDVVEQKHGIDLLLEDRSAASRLLKELRKYVRNLRIKYTAEDIGMKSTGRLRRRLVISVRVS